MADLVGSKDPEHLEGWVLGFWCGLWVMGKPTTNHGNMGRVDRPGDSVDLSPAYEVSLGTQIGPQGVGVQRAAFPIRSFPSVREIKGVTVALLVDELGRKERAHLSKAVTAVEDLLRVMRAEDSGIAIANGNAAKVLEKQESRFFNGRR